MNLLTANRLPYYSGGMITEFHLLSQKIDQLADLTHALRRENAQLRLKSATVIAENAELSRRIEAAHQRVSALMEKFPLPPEPEEEEEVA